MTSLIAMQKVEGSNPFSRFFEEALHVGGFGLDGEPETKWNHRLRVDSTLHWPRRLGNGRAATYP